MTKYNPQDLESNWEFKIVRSATGAFKKPLVLQQVLQEESLGGWQLVEKFDDSRVRLKRPAEARQKDATRPPGYDPYRTRYGIGEGGLAVWIMLGVFGVIGLGVAIAFALGVNF